MNRRMTAAAADALIALLLFALIPFASAQSTGDLSAFVGRWKIDLTRTHMNRGNNLTRSPTFTFVFAPQGSGLNMDVYDQYPQPAPTRSHLIVPDHTLRSCQTSTGCLTVGGNPAEQSYAYYQLDSHMLVRLFYLKGTISEYTTYAVSTDGKTFTMISWSAETPEQQNIQVFDRSL